MFRYCAVLTHTATHFCFPLQLVLWQGEMPLVEKFLQGFDDHRSLFQPLLMRILPQSFRKAFGQAKLFPHCTATSVSLPVFRIYGFPVSLVYRLPCCRISGRMILLTH